MKKSHRPGGLIASPEKEDAKLELQLSLGLPIIRTSVDHGTAFDIAGKGIAHEANLITAIEMAAQMARGTQRGTQ